MKLVQTTENESVQENTESQGNSLSYDDVVIYNEMADQTSVKMNLLEQIKTQMKQLEEMSARRQFMTKEIMSYFSK